MRGNVVKRGIALLAACMLIFGCTMPVYALEDNTEYVLKSVRLSLEDDRLLRHGGKFSGPDVLEDGTVFLEEGKTYNFTLESEGLIHDNVDLHFIMGHGFSPIYALPLNDQGTFCYNSYFSYENMKAQVDFKNVSLSSRPFSSEYEYPKVNLKGDFQITISYSGITSEIEFGIPENREQIDMINDSLDDYYDYVKEGLPYETAFPMKTLESAETVTYKITYSGEVNGTHDIGMDGLPTHTGTDICYYTEDEWREDSYWPQSTAYNCTIIYQGEFYELPQDGENSFFLKPYVDISHCPIEWEMEEYTRINHTGKKAIVTAAAASVFGLGGNAVGNMFLGLSEEDYLPVQKKHIYGEGEEDIEQQVTIGEPPELPEVDTPNVSMSIYKPFKALVNTKGAAANLHITISGEEGLHWNYLPTAICLDGVKAVVPTMLGNGEEATLILAMTGAPLKKKHTSIFVTVIAWATMEDGQLVRTTGSVEIPLHSKGLEAKWKEDGNLQVFSYSDSNLDGIAEVRELREEDYTISEQENGELLVTANETRLGNVMISVNAEKD